MASQKEEKRTAGVAAETMPQVEASNREHVPTDCGDVVSSQLGKLRELFPEVFVEGKIDFDKLRATLGAAAESGPGRFHFSWAGKDDAVGVLQTLIAWTKKIIREYWLLIATAFVRCQSNLARPLSRKRDCSDTI